MKSIISRSEAQRKGLTTYFTGKPCKHLHVADRFTVNATCAECNRIKCKLIFSKNKEQYHKRSRKWYEDNKERHHLMSNIWHSKHRDKVRTYKAKYQSGNGRLVHNLRSRLNTVLKQKKKVGSAVKDLGCTIPDLMEHLENQFYNDMTWENYGTRWHIDHKIPLVSFDLTNPEQIKIACHYTNLQPLLIEDHRKKTSNETRLRRKKVIQANS